MTSLSSNEFPFPLADDFLVPPSLRQGPSFWGNPWESPSAPCKTGCTRDRLIQPTGSSNLRPVWFDTTLLPPKWPQSFGTASSPKCASPDTVVQPYIFKNVFYVLEASSQVQVPLQSLQFIGQRIWAVGRGESPGTSCSVHTHRAPASLRRGCIGAPEPGCRSEVFGKTLSSRKAHDLSSSLLVTLSDSHAGCLDPSVHPDCTPGWLT